MKPIVIIKEPRKMMEKRELDDLELETMQNIVGGYIEEIAPFENSNLTMIINEEGKIKDLEPNIRLGADYIAGTLVIVGNEKCGYRGLTDNEITEINHIMKFFDTL